MKILNEIQSAENIYLNLLEEFFSLTWGKTLLFSHDIDHHRRTWQNAKELLKELNSAGEIFKPELPLKLLIACYLHDLGMSVDPELRHGIHSRELCKSFLLTNNLNETDFSDVLDAVEYHDDKEYKNQESVKNEILKILSIADDLDAFGYIGIYRYLEIYIARGIRPEILGIEIRKNASYRFQNFELNFGNYPELIERHRKRFMILNDFFAEFRDEAGLKNITSQKPLAD